MDFSKVKNIAINNKNVASIAIGGQTVWQKKVPVQVESFCIEDISGAPNEVTMTRSDEQAPVLNLQYSPDNINWQEWTDIYNTPLPLPANSKLYFRGTNVATSGINTHHTFKIKGNCNLLGDLTTLLIPAGGVMDLTEHYKAFSYLFEKNATIINANELILPSVILSGYCYENLFNKCINLETAPALPAMKLASNCYSNTFRGCKKLLSAPALPAKELEHSCYWSTFAECESLLYPPELPAKVMKPYCYAWMLNGCKSLIQPPVLHSTQLADSCYYGLLGNCMNLESAPELPAETLVNTCYKELLWGCKKIKEVKIGAISWNEKYSENWLNEVSSTGTFYKPAELQVWDGTGEQPAGTIPINSPSGIPTGWTVIEEKPEVTPFCVENISGVDNRITFEQSKKGAFDVNLEYSTDNKVWNKWFDYLTGSILLPANGKVYLRGKNKGINIISPDNVPNITYNRFVFEHNVSLSGDLTSLLDPAGNVLDLTGRDFCFNTIFKNNQTIIDASKLVIPCKTLCRASFRCMFEGCSEMLNAPVLPALYLANACYTGLFKGCKKLNNVTALFTSDPNTVMGTVDWLLGTSTTGTFRKNKNAKWERIDASGTNGWEIELVDPAII